MSSRVSPSSLRAWLVAALLVAGTFALFSRAVPYGFLNYDDPSYVTNNAHVRAGLTWEGVVWAFTGHADYWHPLTWLSHLLDWQCFGADARGHRLVSIAWHALNAVLVWLVFRRLTGAFWCSAGLAAGFAWHPLRVESVVWVTERKDVMSGAFFLLTLWAYANYATGRATVAGNEIQGRGSVDHRAGASVGRGRRGWYGATLGLFLLGLMSKPMLVSLPLVLLVLDFWPLRRAELGWSAASRAAWRGLVVEKLPFFALSAVIAGVTIRMQHAFGAFTLELPWDARLANAPVALVRYLGKFAWPFDLSVAYPHPGYWPAGIVAGAVALLAAGAGLAWCERSRRPWLLAGALWFVVVLAPVLGLVQVGFQSMADRYTYLALLGIGFAALWTLRDWVLPGATAWRARLAVAAGVLVAGGLLARTWNQEGRWRDSKTLFEHAIAVTERNDIAHGFLAYTHLGERNFAAAGEHSRRALEIDPCNTTALFTLAAVLETQGRIDEAVSALRRLLEAKPDDAASAQMLGALLLRLRRPAEAEAVFRTAAQRFPELTALQVGLADAIARQGRSDEALALYETALARKPDEPMALNNVAVLLAVLDRMNEARAAFARALAHTPDLPATQTNFGDFLAAQQRWAEALAHYERAAELGATDGATLFGLALTQERLGRSDEAARNFPRALAADPNHAVAHRLWAEGLAKRGRMEEAIVEYRAAVRLDPRDAPAHAGLGYVLMITGRRAEAVPHWEEALRLDPEFPDLRRRLEALGR